MTKTYKIKVSYRETTEAKTKKEALENMEKEIMESMREGDLFTKVKFKVIK